MIEWIECPSGWVTQAKLGKIIVGAIECMNPYGNMDKWSWHSRLPDLPVALPIASRKDNLRVDDGNGFGLTYDVAKVRLESYINWSVNMMGLKQ